MITPELVMQVARAAKDYRITIYEFQQITNTLTSIATGTLVTGAAGLLIGAITEKFARETTFKVEEIAGIPVPVPEHLSRR